MNAVNNKTSTSAWLFSAMLHVVVLLGLILNYESTPLLLLNQNNAEVIQAVAVAAPSAIPKPQPLPEPKIETPPPVKQAPEPVIKKAAIPISPKKENKKIVEDRITQQLLSDLRKQVTIKKQAKNHEKNLQAKKLRELAEKNLRQQFELEQKRLTAARTKQVQNEVDKYKTLILQIIGQNWLVPSTVDKNLFAELLIRLAPGGTVLSVQVTRSSGNEMLDRSAETAVYKASPLPVPNDPSAFESFRQFVLKVKPEHII